SMAVCEDSPGLFNIAVCFLYLYFYYPALLLLLSESSVEYTDSTGIDLHQFIIDTLNSNPRDRMMLIKLEQDMIDFITSNSPFKKFPHMSSYHRMLVHRVAAYFGMEHNVDQTGKSVIINRTSNTRIPEQRFLDEVHKDKTEEIHCWKIILKRDNSSDDQVCLSSYIYCCRIILDVPLRGSRDSSGSSWAGSSRQSSTETDCRYSNDPRPWSSTDSDSSYQWTSPAPKPQEPAHNSAYIMENGIPPGSILMNPHTGQPFLNPDGTPAVYNPPDSQQPIRSQTQLQGSPSQQQQQQVVHTHTHTHTHAQQEVFDMQDNVRLHWHTYMLPFQIEDLSSQFGHVTVSCQSTGDAPPLYPPSQGYIYAAPPPPPPPPNPPSYCQPSPQVHTTHTHTHATHRHLSLLC
uniref:R3H domain-containing protein n=1 Tax=Lates calcarifer TaxID=8187 RepID=A0A4W6CYM2_LATCA